MTTFPKENALRRERLPKKTTATPKLEFLCVTYKSPKDREISKVFTGGSSGIRCSNAFAYKLSINLFKQ
jgi:hypothetical protein